jgi:hypothetical protein
LSSAPFNSGLLNRLHQWLALATALAAVFLAFAPMVSVAVSGCGDGGAVYLTNFVRVSSPNKTMTVSFEIAGGMSNVSYNILTSTNPGVGSLEGPGWSRLGSGEPCGIYTFSNQPATGAFYALSGPLPPPQVTAWSWPSNQWGNAQTNLDLNLSVQNLPNVPASTCQWQFNGTNLYADQASAYSYRIFSITAGQEGAYSATVSNAAGSRSFSWKVHAAFPGGVALWGADDFGQADRPDAAMSNVVAVAAGVSNSLALMANGTVTQWGFNWGNAPVTLTNAVAVSAGYSHMLALTSGGTVVSWGLTNDPANFVPTNLSGVKAIAVGWDHNLALLTNGTVTAWGVDGASLGWHLTEVPPGLSNVIAIAAGSFHSLALQTNGTVTAWGYSPEGETNVPPGLSNVVAIAAGGQHSLALKSDGTVVAWGFDNFGQCNVPPGLSNVIAVAAGWAHSVALKNDGTLVAWGDDSEGQTDLGTNLVNVKSIAAGGYHTIAGMFSPLLQYPLDASRDLLLVYNTNAADSRTVLNYYLKNRPLAATANVLGLGCTNAEMILPSDFTNEIANPIANWLAANPTKRPGYVVLFLDVPSRVGNPTNSADVQASVSVQIATGITNWQPLVTHINMGDTNACIAYINKLASMGSNYSPGKLLISAGAGGYGDANYVIDDIRYGTGYVNSYAYCWWFGADATNGLALNSVAPAAILYTNGTETFTNGIAYNLAHLDNAANVAGYMSWGAHSSLGPNYAVNGELQWTGHSSWFVMATIESFNGDLSPGGLGNFIQWFSPGAFGGANYLNTPVGAVTHVEEPGISGMEDMQAYFGLWAAGENFATCAWQARNTPYYMVVGDPLVCR